MRCSRCFTSNPAAQRFCNACGEALEQKCAHCDATNPASSKFCGGCAKPLAVAQKGESAEAERRHLTVMFVDLVGSTNMSRVLDPEECREVVRTYQATCAAVTRKYEGYTAQYLGDGVLVYFGYPAAHEDAAERAVRAGLEIVHDVGQLKTTHEELGQLKVRVGVHTGLVVIGAIGERGEQLAIGEAPNLAARVQGQAEPGQVLLTDATARLLRERVELEDLGATEMRGFDEGVVLHRAVAVTKGDGPRLSSLPLLGRSEELGVLEAARGEAAKESGRAVLLSGEAGIGKTSLAEHAIQRLAGEGVQVHRVACSQIHRNTALHPLLGLIRSASGLELDGDGALEEVVAHAKSRGLSELEGRGLARALEITVDPESPPLPPDRVRKNTLAAVAAWLAAEAKKGSTCLFIEDLHWADASTMSALSTLFGALPSGMFVLASARPEFVSPWADNDAVQALELKPLADAAARELVEAVLSGRHLSGDLLTPLLERCAGVPLYLEEMTRSLLDSGELVEDGGRLRTKGGNPADLVPATVRDSLVARLDRLGEAKNVAQLAATLGRRFEADLLTRLSPSDEDTLRAHIARLLESGLVQRSEVGGQGVLEFKHALVQDAAYESLLKSTRKRYHARVAEVLESDRAELITHRPELLARHLAGAGEADRAADLFAAAGTNALMSSAYVESIAQYRRALAQLEILPQDAARDQRELGLRAGLGLGLITTTGFATPDVEETYGRALALCGEADEVPIRVLYGVWAVHLVRGDLAATVQLAARFEKIIATSEDPLAQLIAHASLGVRDFFRGDYPSALKHHEEARERFRLEDVLVLVQQYGFDGVLYAHVYTMWAYAQLGERDKAMAAMEELHGLAKTLGDPYTIAMCQCFFAALCHDLGDLEATRDWASKALALSTENDFVFWLACSLCQLGWCQAMTGDDEVAEQGLTMLGQGIGTLQVIGANVPQPYYSSYQIEALLERGKLDEAEAVLLKSLAMTETNVDRNHRPELMRLNARLHRARGNEDIAEATRRRAEELANDQGAKLWAERALADKAAS